jgi:hypothetical protein
MNNSVELLVISVHIIIAALMFLSSVAGQQSFAQQSQPPPTDFFALECDEIKNKVNSLLNAKGPVQQNLMAIMKSVRRPPLNRDRNRMFLLWL